MTSDNNKDIRVETQVHEASSQGEGHEEAVANVHQGGQGESGADAQASDGQPVEVTQQLSEDESIEELDDLEFLLEEIESKIAPLA
jgi:hypothetical protein